MTLHERNLPGVRLAPLDRISYNGHSWVQAMAFWRLLVLPVLGALLMAGCSTPAEDSGNVAPPDGMTAANELVILDQYLALYDVDGFDGGMCQRHGGSEFLVVPFLPDVPQGAPEAATNSLARHHAEWHKRYLDLQTVIAPGDPDPASLYGEEFVEMHRHMVGSYATWRADHGYSLIPTWDPSQPIPSDWLQPDAKPAMPAGVDPARTSTCYAHATEDPKIERPSWTLVDGHGTPSPMFGYESLCEFQDLNELGKAVDYDAFGAYSMLPGTPKHVRYHAVTHDTVQGDFLALGMTVREPLFWAWHNFLDKDVFGLWERECGEPGRSSH